MKGTVDAFFSRVETDAVLRSQLASAETNEQVVSLATSMGYEFSVADYEAKLDDALGIDDLGDGGPVMSGISNCPTHWPT